VLGLHFAVLIFPHSLTPFPPSLPPSLHTTTARSFPTPFGCPPPHPPPPPLKTRTRTLEGKNEEQKPRQGPGAEPAAAKQGEEVREDADLLRREGREGGREIEREGEEQEFGEGPGAESAAAKQGEEVGENADVLGREGGREGGRRDVFKKKMRRRTTKKGENESEWRQN